MSTDDRSGDEQPTTGDEAAHTSATPPLPAMPAWQAPDAAPAAPAPEEPSAADQTLDEPRRGVYSNIAPDEVVVEEEADIVETTATRPPIGGPYVVNESGAPVSEQAVAAYDRQPQGGPYVVTPAEPAVPVAFAATAPPTPYPAAAFAPAPAPVAGEYPPYQPVPQPITVISQPPAPRGNRGGGTLIALVGTVAFAVVYAAVAFVIIALSIGGGNVVPAFTSFLLSAAFIVPVLVFAVALILIVLIVNRAGWWAYVLGGFLVGVLVYFGGIAGALIHVQAWNWQPQEQYDFVRSLLMDPLTLAGAIVAREATIWAGVWIAARGRKVKARNVEAREQWKTSQAEADTGI